MPASGVTPTLEELTHNLYKPRHPHVQQIIEEQFPSPNNQWPGCQFVGFVFDDIRIMKSGDLRVTFNIPPDFQQDARQIADVMTLPLSVDVQLWTPFRDSLEKEE